MYTTSPKVGIQQARYSAGVMVILAAFGLIRMTTAQAETAQLFMPPVGAEGSIAYVQVSSANLRAHVQVSAPVLAKLVTNTTVKVMAKTGGWCEVNVLPSDSLASNKVASPTELQHGFIACNLLSSQPMTLEGVQAQITKKPDAKTLLDLYARAFWIEPSLVRWEQFGLALQVTYLNEATRIREIEKQKPLRYKVPEFDAMKQKLAAGITVNTVTYKSILGWAPDDPQLPFSNVQAAQGRIKMPVIKPSFFKANEIPTIVQSERFGSFASVGTSQALAVMDALSASNGVPFRAVVTGAGGYVLNSDGTLLANEENWRFLKVAGAMDEITGIWDVGGLKVMFDREVILHGVSGRGEPTALSIKEVKLDIGVDSSCSYSPSQIQMESSSIARYAPVSSSIVSWAGKSMPGGVAARAQIKSRRFSGDGEYDLVISHEIDLDKDGIPDFLLWQGRYQAQISAEGIWEAVYANINGQWRLLDYSEDADCT